MLSVTTAPLSIQGINSINLQSGVASGGFGIKVVRQTCCYLQCSASTTVYIDMQPKLNQQHSQKLPVCNTPVQMGQVGILSDVEKFIIKAEYCQIDNVFETRFQSRGLLSRIMRAWGNKS